MGLRTTAAIAAVLVVVGFGAVFLTLHGRPVASLGSKPDHNLVAYRSMVGNDYNYMVGRTSDHCNTIQDTGCAAAITMVNAALQRWISDLDSFHTPAQYAVLDGQLRRHLGEGIAELDAAVAYQKAGDEAGFNRAMNGAFYERAWIDPATFAIEGTYPQVAGSYTAVFKAAKQSLDACIGSSPGPADLACTHVVGHEPCAGAGAAVCAADLQGAATQLQGWMVALAQLPPSGAAAVPAAKFQADLGQADLALLAATDAYVKGDGAKADVAEGAYSAAIVAAQADLVSIAGA